MIDMNDAQAFLSLHRLAIVGASDDKNNFARTIYTALRDHGHDVVAVHPRATQVAGDPCYPDLAGVPGDVDGVVVMVHRDAAARVVRAAIERGVRHVWLFKGIGGAGSVSDDVIALCREHDIAVVEGACPLMFLEPVGFVHRFHRTMRRLNGSLEQTSAA